MRRRWLVPFSVGSLVLALGALAGRPSRAEEPAVLTFQGKRVTIRFEGGGAEPAAELARSLSGTQVTMWRARIPGGWLVSCGSPQTFFVADADHTWDGGSAR